LLHWPWAALSAGSQLGLSLSNGLTITKSELNISRSEAIQFHLQNQTQAGRKKGYSNCICRQEHWWAERLKKNPDAAVQTLESECDGWLKQSIEWIGANMGEAATGRFLDKSNHYAASYSGAVNGEHNRLISALTNFRKNLQVLIVEFDAGNSKD
jgi:hypothetical protein